MTFPTVTSLPGAPARSMSPAAFVAAADALVGALPDLVGDVNAAGAYMDALAAQVTADRLQVASDAALAASSAVSAGVIATSVSNVAITAVAKTFTVQTGKLFAPGMFILAAANADPSKFMIAQVSAYNAGTGQLDLLAPFFMGGAGTYADWTISLAALPQGLTTVALWIPVGAIGSRVTNGAAFGQVETTTNKVILRSLDFDASTIEYGQFSIRMPKSWDGGTVSFAPVWSHAATATNFKVSWGLQGVAISDNEAADAAFGVAQYSNDTGGTTDRIYMGPPSAAITIGGGPAAEDLVVFQVLRKADDAVNDTLAIDARLHGITVYIQTNARSD